MNPKWVLSDRHYKAARWASAIVSWWAIISCVYYMLNPVLSDEPIEQNRWVFHIIGSYVAANVAVSLYWAVRRVRDPEWPKGHWLY